MTGRDDSPPKPALTPKTAALRAARERRLAEALRENLKRRKKQFRGRDADAPAKNHEQEPGKRGNSD